MNTELLSSLDEAGKAARTKRQLLTLLIHEPPQTISEIADQLKLSIPTVTKIIGEMVGYGCVKSYGKRETDGGRYPTVYGLVPEAGYFVGVDVKHTYVNLSIIDLLGEEYCSYVGIPYELDNTPEKLDELCQLIVKHIRESKLKPTEVLNVNVNLPGRINSSSGVSYTSFSFIAPQSLATGIQSKTAMHTTIENDTRGMTYGEYTKGGVREQSGGRKGKQVQSKGRNMLFLNVSWGIGLGIVIDGKIHMGQSGFAGEFGHIPAFENELLCQCGKRGCLETEVSGQALHREVLQRIQRGEASILAERVHAGEELSMSDIVEGIRKEDSLCLDILSGIGRKLGKQVSSLINIFNPELVVIGGALSQVGEYLTQQIRTEVVRYSPRLVNKDAKIVSSPLGDTAGVLGACMLARSRRFAY